MVVGGQPQARTTSASRGEATQPPIRLSSGFCRPPKMRCGIRLRDSIGLQQAYNAIALSPCKQKAAPKAAFNQLISLRKSGAGEGIRTLDPNLGNFFKPSIRQHLFLTRGPLRPYYQKAFLAATHPVGILLLPPETRFFASPMLPRPPPRIPGKQNPEFAL